MNNKQRAQSAYEAIRTFTDFGTDPDGGLETYAGDMLANIMHLCDERGIDFKKALERGTFHYESERPSVIPPKPETGVPFPTDPIARSLSDMITTKQLGIVRAICRENEFDMDEECRAVMKCKVNELSRRAASALIAHLLALAIPVLPTRRAG